MICPECNLENAAGAKFCIHCGSILTQTELTAPSAHRTNQVWNTEIDKDRNQKNSRTALMVLGIAVLLVAALVIALLVSLPSIGDTLIGERAPGQSFSDRFSDFWDTFSDSLGGTPEPAPGLFAEIQGETDEAFLELLEEYIEIDYEKDYTDRLLLPEQYLPEFEEFLTADFADAELLTHSIEMVTALRNMQSSIGSYSDDPDDIYIQDYILWLTGYTSLCRTVSDLYDKYGILYHDSHIPAFFADMLPIYEAELTVEQDLTWQLIGIEAQWSPVEACYYISYTNCTEYGLDITFYNDYETEDDYFYEEFVIEGLQPNESVDILLRDMPEEFENWYTDWTVDAYYIDGEDIYDYYW